MLPQLADLDVAKLSDEAREALTAAQDLADGATLEQIAAKRGVSVVTLKSHLERLAAEWREHSGISALPKLTEEEYEALRDSIQRYGQLVPILADADGNVVDGRARQRACRELDKVPYVEHLPASTSAEELKALALVVNLARRQLAAGAKRGIVRVELLRDASRSDRAIAIDVGVDHKTVGSVRKELELAGEVGKFPTRVGTDGVAQAAAKPERDPQPPPELPDGLLDITLRLTREYAEKLDAGAWLDCRGVRLVLVGPGVYTLEARE